MPTLNQDQLAAKKCEPCHGDIPAYTPEQAREQLKALHGWQLTSDSKRIRKQWNMADFSAGIEFFNAIEKIAEAEDHHPDLHLENYRKLTVEIWTHAIGGLSENDFILAAKIDRLPVKTK